MAKAIRTIAIMLAGILLLVSGSLADGIDERKELNQPSEADLFMQTLDDVMKEELIRSVISEEDEIRMAKMLYGEDRANPTYMRAAIIWCVFNRIEVSHKSIAEDIVPNIYHGYNEKHPVEQWAVDIVRDVALRYVLELNGFTDVGRVLPREYLYFEQIKGETGTTFKTIMKISDPNCKRWDWTLPSPYNDR